MEEQGKGGGISAKAVKSYREEQVNGLSQKQLILMLYDGAMKFVAEAKESIEKKEYHRSYKSIVKARDIIAELLRILDMERGGAIARNTEQVRNRFRVSGLAVEITHETDYLCRSPKRLYRRVHRP